MAEEFVLVTGANGFIGSQVVRSLKDLGFSVVGVDPIEISERPSLLKDVELKKFLHRDQLWDFLNQSSEVKRISWIIHMGANSSTTETNLNHLYEVNTFYTMRLFQFATEHQIPFIYASSAATYGAGENGYDDEFDSEQLKPLNPYGNSKLAFDKWVVRQGKTPANWYGLKFFNVFGPGEEYKANMISVPFKAFFEIKSDGKLKLFKSYKNEYGHGDQKRDFIYVKDVSRWILELMKKKPSSGIYNMGTGTARSWNDLGRAAFSALGIKENIQYIEMPESLKKQYQYFTEANMNKWFKAGMSPANWNLEAAIADYFNGYLKQI